MEGEVGRAAWHNCSATVILARTRTEYKSSHRTGTKSLKGGRWMKTGY